MLDDDGVQISSWPPARSCRLGSSRRGKGTRAAVFEAWSRSRPSASTSKNELLESSVVVHGTPASIRIHGDISNLTSHIEVLYICGDYI